MRRLNLWFVMWFIWAALSPVSTATAQEMPIDETSRLAAVSPAENDKDCV